MNATDRLTKIRKAQGRKQNDTQAIDYIGDSHRASNSRTFLNESWTDWRLKSAALKAR